MTCQTIPPVLATAMIIGVWFFEFSREERFKSDTLKGMGMAWCIIYTVISLMSWFA